MHAETFSLSWLSNPEIFEVNRLAPVSDHEVYRNAEEARRGVSSLKRSLSGQWRMHFAACPAQAPKKYWREGYDDSGFDWVRVPGHIQLQGYETPQYVNVQYPWDGMEALKTGEISQTCNPTASYATRFSLTAEEADSRVVLTLEGVESAAAVWVNGCFIGYGEDGFTPSRYDVTAAVRAGENRLCVQCFKRSSGSWLEDQDFWRYSGIFRDVTLTFEPRAHVEDLFVHTNLSKKFASAQLQADVKLCLPDEAVSLETILTDPEGGEAGRVRMDAAASVTLSLPVKHPLLWNGETPHLYTLTLILRGEDGQQIETARTEVGFRRFEIKNRLMLLNGKRIVFHGVNRHEFDRRSGRALTLEGMLEDIRLLKRHHVNAVRTSHYPNDSRWYRLCDRYGIYLIDETNIETHGTWAYGKRENCTPLPGDYPQWRACVISRGMAMLERDKNHPSVLIWSCGNESWGGSNLYALSQAFRERDPSRLVHYEGVVNDPRYPDTTDICSRMYCKPADIEKYLLSNPDKPFINCEYIHAMGNSCGGMHLYTALEDRYPLYQGGFVWDWVDQTLLVKAPNGADRAAYGGDFGDRPTDYHFIGNGLLLGDRTPTPKAQEAKHLFQPAFLFPEEGGVTIQNRRLFTSLADMRLEWTLALDGVPFDEGTASLPEILPGEKAFLELPVELPEERGEATLTCRLAARGKMNFFAEGETLALGQAILRPAEPAASAAPSASGIVTGSCNTGIHTPSLHALFSPVSKGGNGLVSLKNAAGKEMLLCAPRLSLFRAPTDNDCGNGDNVRQAVWRALSEQPLAEMERLDIADHRLETVYRYTSPVLPDFALRVTYLCEDTESIKITADYPGAAGQSDLPAFGLSFLLNPELTHVRYYGMGPMDNYADRCTGAWLGRFAYEVKDNFVPYPKPQECGNRMGVRDLTVTDDSGAGVQVLAENDALEISVLPWTASQIAEALHPEELPASCCTVLDVACRRKGVGGDDSWGAPVHPEFCISSEKPMRFSFRLKVR